MSVRLGRRWVDWPADRLAALLSRHRSLAAAGREIGVAPSTMAVWCADRGLPPRDHLIPRKGPRRKQTSEEKQAKAEARFWSRVDRSDPDACWLWPGARDSCGYGNVSFLGRRVSAHRLAWELLRGPVPEGHELHHRETCPKRCCNPSHLTPLTVLEHRRTGEGFAAREARQTHCKRGHPLEGANLRMENGKRRCVACACEHKRRWRERQKQKQKLAASHRTAMTTLPPPRWPGG